MKTTAPLWQTVVALGAIMVMLGLGSWQLQRMVWKGALIADRAARLVAEPVALPPGKLEPTVWEFRRVALEGAFRHDLEIQVYGRQLEHGKPGYRVVAPLMTDQGVVLIDRGWVPVEKRDPVLRPDSRTEGRVRVVGIARAPQGQGAFVPENDPAKGAWYWLDLVAVGATTGMALREIFVEADATPNPGGLPVGGQTRSELKDNHAAYAFIWFSLAIACAVIYGLFRRRQRMEAS